VNAIAGSVFMPSAVVVRFCALAFVAEYMEEQVRGWLLDLVSVSRAVILNVEPFAMKLTLPASKIKHRIDTREIRSVSATPFWLGKTALERPPVWKP
jgi:hypothetical protein